MHLERYGAAFYYPLIASRGCPEACTFCFAKKMTMGYRTYPISHVIEQVKRRPKFIRAGYFVDDNLPADPDTPRAVQSAREAGAAVRDAGRHEFSQDPTNVHAAKKAGCALISSGYESVNQLSLDGSAKHADANNYREVIKNIFDAGIMTSGNWMFGFDQDTPDVFERTLEFLDSTELVHSSFTAEIPFPGTASFKRYKREGRLLTEDYDAYVGKDGVVVKPLQMTADQLRDGIRWLALQFFSPRRCTQRATKAFSNKKLPNFGAAWLKAPALLGLNYYQMWQWQYRMQPPLQWLYQRLISVNKYRYVGDLFRGTNFWKDELPRAAAPAAPITATGPFAHVEGFKKGRKHKLGLVEKRPATPR